MKKILIIEDDNALREVLLEKLEQEGYFVLTAKNGEEGLNEIKNNEIDLVLLDMIMPKIDGLTFLKKINQEIKKFDKPVIALTNSTDNEMLQNAMKFGVKDYIIKADWKLKDIVDKIKDKIKTS